MLGRGVAEALLARRRPLVTDAVLELARDADVFLANLECCISARGERWPAPGKPFFFRAPPAAADELARWGVHAVTLANNHALDFGYDALIDTLEHLERVGIRHAGAGDTARTARAPAFLDVRGTRLALVGLTDFPSDFAATDDRPGVAFADLREGRLEWVPEALAAARRSADVVVLSAHWGKNLTYEPAPHIRRAAATLAGDASLVWGHSAHVPHGAAGNVLYDAGDFLDDYNRPHRHGRLQRLARTGRRELGGFAADATAGVRGAGLHGLKRAASRSWGRLDRRVRQHRLRLDLGLLFLVTFESGRPTRLEAVPLRLEHTHTRLATRAEAAPLRRRFRRSCARLGAHVEEAGDRLVVRLSTPARS